MKRRVPASLHQLGRGLRRIMRGWRRHRTDTGPAVEPAARALMDGRSNLHRTFAAFGNDLDELDQQTRSLLSRCEELISLAAGNSEGINLFQDSLQILDQPLAHADQSLQNLPPMLEQITRCDHHSNELLKCQLAMGEVLAPLRHMIVFFRIEAAQLEPEHQTTFLTVADEIHRLRELIDETFDENVARLREARDTVSHVREKVKKDYADYSARISQKRGEIEHAIEALSGQLGQGTQRDTQARETTAVLNQVISRLVSALQYEDILTQRIDHGLKTMRAGPPAQARNAWMQLMHRQVTEITGSLREARNDLDEGIDLIVKHANELGEAAIMLRNLDTSTASVDGMVQLLLEAFQEITEISSDNVRLAEESRRALNPVRDVTENLSSVVIEVSLNIQLIALNAQVRSVQLGDGSGLEVLAARTAEISAELGELGDRTAAEIVELRDVTHAVLAQLEEMEQVGRQHLGALRTRGAEVVERLHHMRDRTLTVLQDVCEEMENVRTKTNPKPQRLKELDVAEACLDRCADWFARHSTDAPVTPAQRQALADHVKSYTMASERRVHAEITGDKHDLGEHDASTELFVDPPPAAVAIAEPAPAASTPAQPGKTPQAAAPAALADNVELF